MAGPGAVIRIDGFEGGALPPKAMIRSIRIARDQFAAEFHSAGGVSIEIITQPGIGRCAFSNAQMRGSSLSARVRSCRCEARAERQLRLRPGGTIVRKELVLPERLRHHRLRHAELERAVLAAPSRARTNPTALRDNLFVNGARLCRHLDQTLRFGYNLTHVMNDNRAAATTVPTGRIRRHRGEQRPRAAFRRWDAARFRDRASR
jgi:hypothetical protein